MLLPATYMAIIYSLLFFSAFPIVYQEERAWSEGAGGLEFVGVAIGMLSGVVYAVPQNFRYARSVPKAEGKLVAPEQRLAPTMVAAPFIPVGVNTLPKVFLDSQVWTPFAII
jgi:hypothetical protein